MNGDLVSKAPSLHETRPRTALRVVGEDIAEKNVRGRGLLLDGIFEHKTDYKGHLWLMVDCTGDYASTWEPIANVPEKIISRYLAKQPTT